MLEITEEERGKVDVCFDLPSSFVCRAWRECKQPVAFTKGANNSVTPQNVPSFSSINIMWEATGTVDANEIELNDDIQIFPNPTKNIFFIRGDNITEIEILNMSGALILKNNSTTLIDMSNFKNGIYLVRIKEGNRTIVKKLVKE